MGMDSIMSDTYQTRVRHADTSPTCHVCASLVSIMAMGGMGKTTLVRLVYDDDDDKTIAKNFDFEAWVCVSDQFAAMSITKTILNLVTYQSIDSHDWFQIQEGIEGKKFLIVLDDFFSDDFLFYSLNYQNSTEITFLAYFFLQNMINNFYLPIKGPLTP